MKLYVLRRLLFVVGFVCCETKSRARKSYYDKILASEDVTWLSVAVNFVKIDAATRQSTMRALNGADDKMVEAGLPVLIKAIDDVVDSIAIAKGERTYSHVSTEQMPNATVVIDLQVSQAIAAEMIDQWLTPRFNWALIDESPGLFILRRNGHPGLTPLLLAYQRIQFNSVKNQCSPSRVAIAGDGFIGASLNALSKDIDKNLRYADAPVVPLVFKSWPYIDANWYCPEKIAFSNRNLECFFLKATDCSSQLDTSLLHTSTHDQGSRDIPTKGSGEICGHSSLLLVRNNSAETTSRRDHSNTKKSNRKIRSVQSSWHITCREEEEDDESNNTSRKHIMMSQLLGAAGDNIQYLKHRVGPKHSRDRKFFGGREKSIDAVVGSGLLRFGALILMAMRPNRRLRAEIGHRTVQWRRKNTNFLAQGEDKSYGHCIALHIRHGDKLTPLWQRNKAADRGFARSFDDYIRVALAAFSRNNSLLNTNSSKPQILFMTDDKDIMDEAPRMERIHNVELYSVRPGRPLVSTFAISNSSEAGNFNHQKDCVKALHQRKKQIISVKQAIRAFTGSSQSARSLQLRDRLTELIESKVKTCAHDYLRDPATGKFVGSEELLQWLVTWELMSHCNLFVGYSIKNSFFTELIYVWLCALRFRRGGSCPRLVLLESINPFPSV